MNTLDNEVAAAAKSKVSPYQIEKEESLGHKEAQYRTSDIQPFVCMAFVNVMSCVCFSQGIPTY